MKGTTKKTQTERELDEQIAVLQWWKGLREANNEAFLPLFLDEHRYLVLCGGGGSGKSIFAGRKVLERVTSEAGHRWLVCRKVARTLRESCFKQLISQAGEFYPESGMRPNKSDMLITFANGSEIIFAGLDDVEKLKSIYNITGIWIEEASELSDSSVPEPEQLSGENNNNNNEDSVSEPTESSAPEVSGQEIHLQHNRHLDRRGIGAFGERL